MIDLLILLAISCPATVFENVTQYPWNSHDKEVYKTVTRRCGEIYKDTPCVKLFRKFGKQDYSVICGK